MTVPAAEDFDWIKIKQEIGSKDIKTEGNLEKLKRKCVENPFVPLGALLTTAFLAKGLHTLKTGDRQMSQKMMRGRVVAQGLTVVALCGGVALNALRSQQPPAKGE